LPAGYAPFGIQAITVNNTAQIYVTYAKTVAGSGDNANGAGLGMVNVFDVHGTLQETSHRDRATVERALGRGDGAGELRHLQQRHPRRQLRRRRDQRVRPGYRRIRGTIADANGQPFANPGLWVSRSVNGVRNQPTTTLYFAAGIADEADGVYGAYRSWCDGTRHDRTDRCVVFARYSRNGERKDLSLGEATTTRV